MTMVDNEYTSLVDIVEIRPSLINEAEQAARLTADKESGTESRSAGISVGASERAKEVGR